MEIKVNLNNNSYSIFIQKGILDYSEKYLRLDRKVLILTDDGVPSVYSEAIAKKCLEPYIVCVNQGEGSKSLEVYTSVLKKMLENKFTRSDCVVAVGGGVCGDLAGFCAASYMRGIDFYNIPTTVLSQVDSSVGGKTAVNLNGVKNIVGAFWQPKAVLIDTDTLKTLDKRQFSNGLAEALKAGLIADKILYEMIEGGVDETNIEAVIIRSLEVKRKIVEADEREADIRKMLNFGHTIGHAVESAENLSELLHGECVAIGIPLMCGKEIRTRVENAIKSLNLPTKATVDFNSAYKVMLHDKKCKNGEFEVTVVDKIGEGYLLTMTCDELSERLKEVIADE